MKKIDTSKWKEFVVGDLFDIHPTKAYKRINIELFEENGTNPVIVNTGFNNGVGGYANLDCTEKAGTITFTDTAAKSTDSFFYQERTLSVILMCKECMRKLTSGQELKDCF